MALNAIEFLVSNSTDDCDLFANEFDATGAFAGEVRSFLGLVEEGEPLIISLLGPFRGGFAAPDAFDVICDAVAAVENPPDIHLLVGSERAAAGLRTRMSTESREPKAFNLGRYQSGWCTVTLRRSKLTPSSTPRILA